MKRKDDNGSSAYVDLRGDGRIVLYKRMHLKRPKWQARLSVRGAKGYDQRSTGTEDFEDAKRWALNRHERLSLRVMAGHPLRTPTFKQVYDEWSRSVGGPGSGRGAGSKSETATRVANYALEFFGSRRIDEIGDGDFMDYWAWRSTNFARRSPTPSTLKRERTGILAVFRHALRKGYIGTLPQAHLPKVEQGRRPTFTRAEWAQVLAAAPEWVAGGKALATWRDRFMALHFFVTLANSGLRTGELQRLRWCDLVPVAGGMTAEGDRGSYLTGVADGKTGRREFVFNPGTEVSLKKVYLQRCKEVAADTTRPDQAKPASEEPIFCHPNGKPIADYGRSFASLLKFAGVPISKDGKPRTPYSLRHYHATRQLSKGISPFLLAKQMGTSVEMLERHYGQVITKTLGEQITGAKPVHIPVQGIDFPF